MLLKLSVNNYALIDELNIDFGSGLSIITGETGSGKSILLGALSLILGQRADTSVLQDKGRKCIVEGEFDISGYRLNDYFEINELDYDDHTIIRREINESDKSRAFINDTPVTLNILRDLGVRLVDIHSQHSYLVLSANNFQLDVIDAIAGNNSLSGAYKSAFHEYSISLKNHNNLKEKAEKEKADLDYIKFQLAQLESAKLVAGEQDELEEELQFLTHSGEIKEALNYSCAVLDEDDNSLLSLLKDIHLRLGRIRPFFNKISDLLDRVESSLIELRDVAGELSDLENHAEFDPGRIDFINNRLDVIYGLQQKHRVGSVDELIVLREELQQKIGDINNYELSIEEAGKKLDEAREKLSLLAEKLTSARLNAFPVLEEHMISLLRQLGIPNAQFVAEHHRLDDFAGKGVDRIIFMFSANRQSPPMELSKVASGGEISRVMLSLKSLIAKSVSLPTIIFDEIDSGVSGEIAGKMGRIMKEMSENMQVINITHLPQIAGKGDQQFHVYKEDVGKSTHTRIKLLTREERINEIARMLSSDGLSEAAITNARELLQE